MYGYVGRDEIVSFGKRCLRFGFDIVTELFNVNEVRAVGYCFESMVRENGSTFCSFT